MALAPDGKQIRTLRYELGLTQASLAARADVHYSHVYRIEEGTRGATPPVLKRIADALGVAVADITTELKEEVA
jgi:transcriptional regulator with XRE-family HTH domain